MPSPSKPRDRRFRNDEYERLHKISRNTRSYFLKPLIIIAVETGMRLGELLNMRWENFDREIKILFADLKKSDGVDLAGDIFDDNFFFFFEEIDLCKKIKNMKENIFIFNKIKIKHENTDSVDAADKKIYDNFRNWNYYWSSYYYHKKHYGLLSSITKHLSKLFRFLISALFFYLFSDTKHRTNKFRFYGLVNSILGVKSSNSDKILNKINS